MEASAEVNATLSLMIGGIAAISLLVGGISITNIMLVSVREQTRENGIPKAIGADGGGIGFSWIALHIIGYFMEDTMSFHMNSEVIGLSVLFSGIIGVVFGLYPAAKAAGKKPIDALRYSG